MINQPRRVTTRANQSNIEPSHPSNEECDKSNARSFSEAGPDERNLSLNLIHIGISLAKRINREPGNVRATTRLLGIP